MTTQTVQTNQTHEINKFTLSLLFQIYIRLDKSDFAGDFEAFVKRFVETVNYKKLKSKINESIYPGEMMGTYKNTVGVFIGLDGNLNVVYDLSSNMFVYDVQDLYSANSGNFIEDLVTQRPREDINDALVTLLYWLSHKRPEENESWYVEYRKDLLSKIESIDNIVVYDKDLGCRLGQPIRVEGEFGYHFISLNGDSTIQYCLETGAISHHNYLDCNALMQYLQWDNALAKVTFKSLVNPTDTAIAAKAISLSDLQNTEGYKEEMNMRVALREMLDERKTFKSTHKDELLDLLVDKLSPEDFVRAYKIAQLF